MSRKSRDSLVDSCFYVSVVFLSWLLTASCINAVNDPAIVNDIQNLTKSAGEWCELDCTVKDRATRKIYWEQEFNGNRILISNDNKLVASNPVGGEYPNNKTKYELDVIYNSDQSYTYRLRINRLEASDAGVYVCSLVQVDGSAQPVSKQGSITIRGVVTDAPQIVVAIGTGYGQITKSATLQCLVANKKNHQVIWKRGRDNLDITSDTNVVADNPIVEGTTHKFSVAMTTFTSGDRFDLTVNGLGDADNGTYECRVMSGQSIVTSATGQIYVQVPPEISSPTPENITLAEGGSRDLTCTATGSPDAPVIWQRADLGYLPNGEQTYRGPTMGITNAKKEQRGLYKCQAANGVYPPDEKTFRVHVRFDPIATPLQKTYSQAIGFPVTIYCIMEGYPKVMPSWNKLVGGGRTPINPDSGFIITEVPGNGVTAPIDYSEYSLRIERLKEEDFGEYECVGRSDGGTSNSAVIKLLKSDTCTGSGCPGTQPPSVTKTNPNGSTCKGDNCIGGSSPLRGQILFVFLLVSVAIL